MPILLRRGLACLLLLLGLGYVSTLAAAQIVIIESSVPGLDAGSIMDAGEIVAVPAGAHIVIVEPDGSSRTIDGPYDAPIGAVGATSQGGSLIDNLGKLVKQREEERQILGVIRAAPGQIADRVYVVDIARSRTICVPAGQPLVLWRPATMAGEAETRIEAGAERAVLLWHEGERELAWPASPVPRDGGRYLVRLDFAPRPAVIELRFIPPEISSDPARAAWMFEMGCRRQAERLLAGIADGGRQPPAAQ